MYLIKVWGYNQGYIASGKTKLYAKLIIDIFNEVDNSTWIYTLKQIFWVKQDRSALIFPRIRMVI